MAWVSHEAIVELDSQGLTAREIAERLGISTRTVNRVRVETGHQQGPGCRSRYTPEFIAKVEKHLEEGWSITDIARTYDVNQKHLTRRFKGRGWTRQQCAEFGSLVKKLQSQKGLYA